MAVQLIGIAADDRHAQGLAELSLFLQCGVEIFLYLVASLLERLQSLIASVKLLSLHLADIAVGECIHDLRQVVGAAAFQGDEHLVRQSIAAHVQPLLQIRDRHFFALPRFLHQPGPQLVQSVGDDVVAGDAVDLFRDIGLVGILLFTIRR